MDLTFKEVHEAWYNPDKKEAMKADLMSNVEVIEDESGNKVNIIRLKDLVLAPEFFNDQPRTGFKIPGELMEKMKAMEEKAPPGTFDFMLKDRSSMPLRDDDIVLMSFPKTGTHWFCNLLHFLTKTGPLEEEVSQQPPLIDIYPLPVIESMPSPRVLATHLIPQYAPTDIFNGKCKKILVFRNPKDALVSMYHHMKKLPLFGEMNLSWNCFAVNAMKGLIPPMGFCDYYNAWQKAFEERKDLDILIMYYEKMKTDPLNELKKMNDYLGLPNDEARLLQVLDKCSINTLRNDVNTGKVSSLLVDNDGKSVLYRKGVIGDWKNHFTVAQSELMDELVDTKLKDTIFEILY